MDYIQWDITLEEQILILRMKIDELEKKQIQAWNTEPISWDFEWQLFFDLTLNRLKVWNWKEFVLI